MGHGIPDCRRREIEKRMMYEYRASCVSIQPLSHDFCQKPWKTLRKFAKSSREGQSRESKTESLSRAIDFSHYFLLSIPVVVGNMPGALDRGGRKSFTTLHSTLAWKINFFSFKFKLRKNLMESFVCFCRCRVAFIRSLINKVRHLYLPHCRFSFSLFAKNNERKM